MMKQNWEYKKLGECGIVVTGNTPSKKDAANYSSNDFCFVKPNDIEKDGVTYINQTCEYISKKAFEKSRRLPKGAVLTTCIGIIGKVAILEVDATCNQQINAIIPNGNVDSKFLAYGILSIRNYLTQKANAPVVPIINKGDFSEILIPVPPLSEQSRIVAELDLLTGIIDKQNAQLKELDNLAQAIFYDMFGDPIENRKGWDVKNIGDIADVKIGPFGSLLHASDYINGGHPVINPVHLKAGKIIAEDDFTVNDDMYAQMMSYVLHKNDIIFGRRGDIGRCALVTQEQDGYLCGTGSLFVRFNIQVQPLFSVATLMHKSITDFLLKKAKGATMLNINCGIVEDIPFILPPLALQQSFAEKIQSIEKQKETIRASIADTQKLLDYTMDKYFG